MIRYIKAIFGIYDHKPYTKEQFIKKFGHLIQSWFDVYPITDEHVGGPYEDNHDARRRLKLLKNLPPEVLQWVISFGDIFDFVKANLKNLEWMYEEFVDVFLLLPGRYRLGNHEGFGENHKDLFSQYFDAETVEKLRAVMSKHPRGECILSLPNGVSLMIDHGDLFTEKQRNDYIPYRYKKHGVDGADLVKVQFLDKLDWFKTKRPLPEGWIEAVYAKMIQNGADVAMVGHFHCESVRYYFYKGKVIICLPAHQFLIVGVPKLRLAA